MRFLNTIALTVLMSMPVAGRSQRDCAPAAFNVLPESGAAGSNVQISGTTLWGRGCRLARGLRVLFARGERETELIRITDPETSVKIDVKVPADAAPGMAQFVMELWYSGDDALKVTRPFTVISSN
jgi:hypothetical protein